MRRRPSRSINPNVPLPIEQIVTQTLAKEPAQRYRNADQLGRILVEYQYGAEQATGLQAPVPRRRATAGTSRERTAGRRADPGFDWLAWGLAAIALIAVVGLIVLWTVVYRVYTSAPRIPPTPTEPAPAHGDDRQRRPTNQCAGVVHLDRKDVEKLLAQAGLPLVVKEERPTTNGRPALRWNKSPPQGTSVKRGDVVQVVFSKGPKVSNVLSVQGSLYDDEIKAGLESYGWKVVLDPQWSTDPISKVIGQIPPPGIPLTTGLVITLQISSGSVISLDANLGNLITLDSADLLRDTLRPGESIEVTLRWKARVNKIGQAYKVFVHLIGPNRQAGRPKLTRNRRKDAPRPRPGRSTVISDPYVLEFLAMPHAASISCAWDCTRPAILPLACPSFPPARSPADNNSLLIKTLTIGP